MATVEEMLSEQNQGFGLDAVTGVTGSGDQVPWEAGLSQVWREIAAPYAKLKLGLSGDATRADTPTGSYREGQTSGATAKQKANWTLYAVLGAVALGALLMLRK